MVRLQRLTGCRPEEICILRPCDVDRSSEVWAYRPTSHKMSHCGRDRVIFIGPRTWEILMSYLDRPEKDYCFCPEESERSHRVERREQRQSPMTPSQGRTPSQVEA